MAKCPACGLGEKYQKPAPEGFDDNKTLCTGCGTVFFSRN